MAYDNEGTTSSPTYAAATKTEKRTMSAAIIRKSAYPRQLTLFAIVTLASLTIICSSQAQSYADYLMPIKPVRPYEESVERLLGNRWGHGTMIYSDLTGVTGESFA